MNRIKRILHVVLGCFFIFWGVVYVKSSFDGFFGAEKDYGFVALGVFLTVFGVLIIFRRIFNSQ